MAKSVRLQKNKMREKARCLSNLRHLVAMTNGRCWWCRCKLIATQLLKECEYRLSDQHVTIIATGETGHRLTVDHLEPLGRSPTKDHNALTNLVPACKTCNSGRAEREAREALKSAKRAERAQAKSAKSAKSAERAQAKAKSAKGTNLAIFKKIDAAATDRLNTAKLSRMIKKKQQQAREQRYQEDSMLALCDQSDLF